jgi:hypothetical protein
MQFLSFLTPKISGYAIAALLAVIVILWLSLSGERSAHKETIDALALQKANYQTCVAENALLKTTIDAQNKAIEDIQAQAAIQQARASQIAIDSLKKRQKQREASALVDGAGAGVMNAWLRNTFSQ